MIKDGVASYQNSAFITIKFSLRPTLPQCRSVIPAHRQAPLRKAFFGNPKQNILVDLHAVELKHVQAFSGWFMGGENQGLAKSTDMIIKAIDPNKVGNLGLVNRRKIRLRRLSIAVHFIIKNHIKRSSYNSFQPDKAVFEYTEEVSGRKIVCGLILLKLLLIVMKP